MENKATEWVKFDGSDEQIAELKKVSHKKGLILRTGPVNETEIIPFYCYLSNYEGQFTHYLICKPHPLADMIIRQAQTGQPVWIYIAFDRGIGELEKVEYRLIEVTTTPDWNISNAEYSFTPWED